MAVQTPYRDFFISFIVHADSGLMLTWMINMNYLLRTEAFEVAMEYRQGAIIYQICKSNFIRVINKSRKHNNGDIILWQYV